MQLFLSLLGLGSLANIAHAGLGALNFPGGLPFLFNGAALINHPNWTSQHPRDSTLEGANFFSYVTDKGYLSFGWWLKPSSDTDYSHCKPDSSDFMWYEWSDKMYGCDDEGCKAHVVNYLVANNSEPSFETDYVFGVANLAAPELGSLSKSYFDEKQGASAVATRHVLSTAATTASDCCKALKTLRGVQNKYKIKLDFELVDICPQQKTVDSWHQGQIPLGGGCDLDGEFGHELR
ncbi:hypothetical protein P170DRAFT_479554 [Aspergillus steynii IBT 23096]|uniref:Uncharacterized protein n=1 Tax=Aspergillus steynii IBT 23096 TaxID=1392250 RepID=A0A2I2FWU0_9EURO|nr:uncharacterized protein P170DRAFT_479554 [Aspergillus steynii IBT 23096]PLB45026.1 hypothetical protein P170DRAFT_479554 [Aspergillus steynii IBT 23096]